MIEIDGMKISKKEAQMVADNLGLTLVKGQVTGQYYLE